MVLVLSIVIEFPLHGWDSNYPHYNQQLPDGQKRGFSSKIPLK